MCYKKLEKLLHRSTTHHYFCQTPLQLADPTQLQLVEVGVDFVFPRKKKREPSRINFRHCWIWEHIDGGRPPFFNYDTYPYLMCLGFVWYGLVSCSKVLVRCCLWWLRPRLGKIKTRLKTIIWWVMLWWMILLGKLLGSNQ